ncbi:hypothetical protein M432DRAFT_358318 [Thermoascus aurantiacus ATCC 26904]
MTETVRSRIVQGLAGIPPEIAHQILDDLTLSDILKLACYDIPYINDCIMSHPACGKFFANSSEAFILTRDYFRLYRELQVIRCEKTVPLDSFLAASLSWASFDCGEVQRWMHTRIFRTLDLTRDQVDLLCPYAPPQSGPLTMVWDSSTLSALQNRREIIRSAQADLNRIKIQSTRTRSQPLGGKPGYPSDGHGSGSDQTVEYGPHRLQVTTDRVARRSSGCIGRHHERHRVLPQRLLPGRPVQPCLGIRGQDAPEVPSFFFFSP